MTTETKTSEPIVATGGNARQRKLRVMARCDVIVPDKRHGQGFDYLSIQAVSNHLRKILSEEGLSYEPTFNPEHDGWMKVELVNADDATDRIVSHWPVIPNDKAFAYSTKFPLIRMFLVGDGEENDEAEMATASGTRPALPPKNPPARPSAPAEARTMPRSTPSAGVCPECESAGYVTNTGKVPKFYENDRTGRMQCNGRAPNGGPYANHVPLGNEDVSPRGAVDDVDPSEIPW